MFLCSGSLKMCSWTRTRGCLNIREALNSIVRLSKSRTQTRQVSQSVGDVHILGIETSCDDTGVAVVDGKGNVLGEALRSQLRTHIEYGGIIPPIARDLHQQNIEPTAMAVLEQCPLQINDIDAIAVTVRPGMSLALKVGLTFAKELARKHHKPLIPIHHMEAHALAVRLKHRVQFPYLVLLVSGGHCQLAVVRGVDDFLLLGQTADDAPGEAFDKLSRRMKLHNIPECQHLSGGQAIEFLARDGNPLAFSFPEPMTSHRSCNFSFSGLKHSVLRQILRLEKEHGIEADALIPEVADMCASVQHAVVIHLLRRTQRAINYCLLEGLLPSISDSPDSTGPTLVVSGGVACNSHLRSMLLQLCETGGVTLVTPPKELCTDNGIMIAWNGVERWNTSLGVTHDLDSVDIVPRCPLGTDISMSVTATSIKSERLHLKLD